MKFCRCGSELTSAVPETQCIKCGASCCSTCAYLAGTAAYCARCVRSMLEAEPALRGPLAASEAREATGVAEPNGSSNARERDLERAGRPRSDERIHWIVLVARDQPELLAHLARAFARDAKVEIVMDRRKDYSRNPPGMEDRLRTHGAAVISRFRR